MRRRSDRKRIPVHIGVVAQHINGHRCVFGRAGAVVVGHRCIVHRSHRHGHGGQVGIHRAIVGGVGEAVHTVEVGVGRVGHIGAVVDHRAVGRLRYRAHRERIPVHIGVVAQHINGRGRVILGYRRHVIHRHRRIIHAGDRHGHRGRVRTAVPVVDGVGEAVQRRIADTDRLELAVRIIVEGPIRINREQGAGRQRDLAAHICREAINLRYRQRVAVGVVINAVTVVGQHVNGTVEDGVLVCSEGIILGFRRFVAEKALQLNLNILVHKDIPGKESSCRVGILMQMQFPVGHIDIGEDGTIRTNFGHWFRCHAGHIKNNLGRVERVQVIWSHKGVLADLERSCDPDLRLARR